MGRAQVWLLHCPNPKAPHWTGSQRSTAIWRAPGHPTQAGALALPGSGRAWHPGPCPLPGGPIHTPGKGTQQAIPTRSPAAQYSNSWEKWEGPGIQRKEWSSQRKNRKDCEKELWMKCEKQRHRSEENGGKPQGNRHPQPTPAWLPGEWEQGGCFQPGPQPSPRRHSPARALSSPWLKEQHLITPSFAHSSHSLTMCPAQISCPSTVLIH